jgi:uncharacterized protein
MAQNTDDIQVKRIQSIDVLRGIALLGLPTMNIIHFSMPEAAYMNPYVFKADAFLNHVVFSFFNVFSDQKFMGLFTLLFGASLLLLRDKNEQRGSNSAVNHYSRMFLLLLLGILHFWFIWSGDVLMFYAIVGMVLFPLAKLPAHVLFAISSVFLTLTLYCIHIPNVTIENMGEEGFSDIAELYAPDESYIASHKALMLGTYAETMSVHRDDEIESEAIDENEEFSQQVENASQVFGSLGLFILFKIITMVTLGMALFKTNIIQGDQSSRFYKNLAIFGIGIGGLITIMGLVLNYLQGWNIQSYFSYTMLLKELGSVLMTLGYVGFFIYLIKSRVMAFVWKALANVGQMALTNYLSQSIICAFIFYGAGLGLFGSVSRLELLPIIVGIWITQIIISVLWLKFFMQGPIEWLWRSMSSVKFSPILNTKS